MLGDFEYKRIRSIEEGCRLLVEAEGDGVVLAGGTDLLVELRNGLKSPRLLVDCKGLDHLQSFSCGSDGATIGSTVPMNRLIEHRAFRAAYPALVDALQSIGTYQLRNRATVAGNICNGSPAADSAPVLLVQDARVNVEGAEGRRSIPIGDFFTGVKRTALQPDEIVTDISLPDRAGRRSAFLKQQRIRGHDLAVVNIAGEYDLKKRQIRIAIGSCAPTPVLLDPFPVDTESVDELAGMIIERVRGAVAPISDVRASAQYRNAILPVLVKRILQRLLSEGGSL